MWLTCDCSKTPLYNNTIQEEVQNLIAFRGLQVLSMNETGQDRTVQAIRDRVKLE
jgi:hypothetical protein